jgi:hypothetical protein
MKEEIKRNAKELFGGVGGGNREVMEVGISNRGKTDKGKAFYDEQYYTYLKTNMKYLSEMSGNKNRHSPNIHTNSNILINNFRDQIKN